MKITKISVSVGEKKNHPIDFQKKEIQLKERSNFVSLEAELLETDSVDGSYKILKKKIEDIMSGQSSHN